ncbi:ABC-type multidrug transport system, ATpase component [Clostridium aceticum]|uniref:ABC-type multidrug transport system, ATpase component n=1 Tax=Clostridium aceticum TaxID=84022 RepID=A0A0G3WCV3_9CLOT|nr:ABC transporter ATP-binding protein [Clostridium aceticum]AKL95757.1 ABC-type multidrug transport system, ATpase component [Clostridium aceticum]
MVSILPKTAKGEIFGFLGPSGAGKSTVQNIMTGLLPLQKGDVLYEGQSLKEVSPDFYNQIGVSFEHPNLYSKLTAQENLVFFSGLFDTPTEDPIKLLDMVGLRESARKKAINFSKGMKQRLVFARALLNNPKILFLDEPTSGLDPTTANKIKGIIYQKKKEGCTIFLTTHNMMAADELCDRIAFLYNGKIVAMDSPRALKLQYGKKAVQVEYRDNKEIKSKLFFLNNKDELKAFNEIVSSQNVETIHTQEATLEQIFIKLTGRGLE